jgi:maleate isomerase
MKRDFLITRKSAIKTFFTSAILASSLNSTEVFADPIPSSNTDSIELIPKRQNKNLQSLKGEFIKGELSDRKIFIPNPNTIPMPSIAEPGFILNGKKTELSYKLNPNIGYPDVRSHKKKFGLLIPATNTSMEHELWRIIFSNYDKLKGIGIHTTNVLTPKPNLKTPEDLEIYKKNFLAGLESSVDSALLAQPEYVIVGMSLEHILYGLDKVKEPITKLETIYGIGFTTWHDAIKIALEKFKAKRIGILTPFDKQGNQNAEKMFRDLGFDVIASFGFSCANALHIAHIPDEAKKAAIKEVLATKENKLDAIVQCGTNMSLVQVSDPLEIEIEIPILGINTVLLWHAFKELGIKDKLLGASRIFREF